MLASELLRRVIPAVDHTTVDDDLAVVGDVLVSGDVTAATFNGGTLPTQGITALTGPVTASGAGVVAATISNGAVTLANLADLVFATIIGRNTNSTGVPEAVTMAQLAALLTADNNGVCAAYFTGVLDFLATPTGQACIPAKAGFYFDCIALRPFVATRTGSASTGTLAYSLGSNAGQDNMGSGTTAAANINAAAAPINASPTTTVLNGTTAAAANPITAKITGALGGATTCTGRLVAIGVWLPS